MMDDLDLLRAYVGGSEDAFRALVERHGRLVYSVCLRQLRRADLAEDATQVAFALLAAKAARLSPTVSLAAWLQRAAWHVARRLGRAEGRRERHEKGAEMRQTPETRPEVDEALAALPEKYRDPICLRYLERRSPEEVARLLGCGVDAARMRISRGLERMRGFLERRGAPFALAALVVFLEERLLEAAPPGLAARVASEVLSGRTATSHAPLLAQLGGTAVRVAAVYAALAVIALLSIVASAWTWTRPAVDVRLDAKGVDLRSTASLATRGETRTPLSDIPQPASAALLRGRILCVPDGRPASGLRVQIEAEDVDLPEMIVFTREDGTFVQELPEGRYRVGFHSLIGTLEGGLLDQPATFVGQAPAPLAPAGFYYPEHELEHTYPSRVYVDAYRDRPGEVEFRVRASRLISGRIRTDDGRVPERTIAVLRRDGDEIWVELNPREDGTFDVPHSFEGGFHVEWLKIDAQGRVPGLSRPFDVPARGDVTQIDVTLTRGAAVIGGVEGPDGRPLVQATVSILPLFPVHERPDALRYSTNWAKVDEHGRFRVDGCVAGRYLLVAEDERRHAPREVEIEVPGGALLADAGRIVLEPGATFRGRVVDERGAGIAKAFLFMIDAKEVRTVPTGRSDGDGRFSFEHVLAPDGRLRILSVSADGFLRRSLREIPCGPEFVVTLGRACRLEVRLLCDTPRKVDVALAGVDNGEGEKHQLNVGPADPYTLTFDTLPAGEYELRVSDLAGNTLSERKITLDRESTELDVRW